VIACRMPNAGGAEANSSGKGRPAPDKDKDHISASLSNCPAPHFVSAVSNLATYPAMMKCFETFDVGFFDLIIADESHRTTYNRYRDLFEYFDAYQVGLTATPVKDSHGNRVIPRDTFRMFDCEEDDPTFNYGFP